MNTCQCDSCVISRVPDHPWRVVRSVQGNWGHFIYWATHSACCGAAVPFTPTDWAMCKTCAQDEGEATA